MSCSIKYLRGKCKMFTKYGISKGIDSNFIFGWLWLNSVKSMFFQKRSLEALFLDWGQIPATVVFLTIMQNYIQKITSLHWDISAQWAIEKRKKSKNIWLNTYGHHLICKKTTSLYWIIKAKLAFGKY